MTHRARATDDALDAFIAAKTVIDAMLARLQALSDDHFNADPGSVNWADVATLNHYRARLREICDMAFNEGEHAA
jgi:uncharacterized damage-inducible protein DinB